MCKKLKKRRYSYDRFISNIFLYKLNIYDASRKII